MRSICHFCVFFFFNTSTFTIKLFFLPLCSPELEKGLKKRVKLHTYENGENGQSRENGQHAQNEDIDSDDNYTEVGKISAGL